jgi:hypothetical protein
MLVNFGRMRGLTCISLGSSLGRCTWCRPRGITRNARGTRLRP